MQDGFLTVSVIDSATNRPIENATVNIYKNLNLEKDKLKYIKI